MGDEGRDPVREAGGGAEGSPDGAGVVGQALVVLEGDRVAIALVVLGPPDGGLGGAVAGDAELLAVGGVGRAGLVVDGEGTAAVDVTARAVRGGGPDVDGELAGRGETAAHDEDENERRSEHEEGKLGHG